MSRKRLGGAGERLAERVLVGRGWQILDRNWRRRTGEVDLIAMDGDVLVFVEVKTRRGARHGAAEEAIDETKAERLLTLGEEYVALHPEYETTMWRVDLMAITLGPGGTVERLTHIPNACETG